MAEETKTSATMRDKFYIVYMKRGFLFETEPWNEHQQVKVLEPTNEEEQENKKEPRHKSAECSHEGNLTR
jgi:hypothetical protein